MIDIQTYRSRISSASGMMDKILRRKATRFKSFQNETQHEDQDLLRKNLKTATVFHFSYLLLVLLVIMINVIKVSIPYQPLIKFDIHHVYDEFITRYLPSSFDVTFLPSHCEHLMEYTFGIFSIALCLSSIGAVHFISILLLIAGIEPNPGPKHKNELSGNGETSECGTAREDNTLSSNPSDFQGFLTDSTLMKLSKEICDRNKLYSVGINLGLSYQEIRTHDTNNLQDIKMAALHMLKSWHIGSTKESALDKLVEAFLKSGIVMPLHDFELVEQTTNPKNRTGSVSQHNRVLLHKLMTNPLFLSSVGSLSLSGKGFTSLPDLRPLTKLQTLDLSCNSIDDIQNLESSSLKGIELHGNPFETLNFDPTKVPILENVKFGSSSTRFVTFPILEKVYCAYLQLDVVKEHQDRLLLPPYGVFHGSKNDLRHYIDSGQIELKDIPDIQDRHSSLLWFISNNPTPCVELDLSEQKDLCEKFKTEGLQNLLCNEKLANLESLSLDSCSLDVIPLDGKSLPYLKQLSVRDNKFTKVCDNFLSLQSLEKLSVDGNNISIIEIPEMKNNFPNLKHIQAGSLQTKDIAMELLEVAAKGELTIDIVPEYREQLVFPPYEVLKGGSNSLSVYIKDILSSQNVLKNTTQNILMFLGNTEAGKTSLKRTLKANAPRTTLQSDRTVILETDMMSLDDNTTITTNDFGGHDIYEIEYPIFLRGQNIIVLIVVDISLYRADNHDELVTRWIHNCVHCAECKVIFVPTKIEELTTESVDFKLGLMEEFLKNWLKEEISFLQDVQTFLEQKLKLKQYKNVQNDQHSFENAQFDANKRRLKFYEKFEIVIKPTSCRKMKGIEDLKKEILDKVTIREVRLPAVWNEVLEFIKMATIQFRYYFTMNDIQEHIEQKLNEQKEQKSIEECLRYLSAKGIILWYSEIGEYIYNNTDNILELHKKLFRHDLKEHILFDTKFWCWIEDEVTFYNKKSLFISSGLLCGDLLHCLWLSFNLQKNEYKSMIELLKVNDLCFEYDNKYKFPWFTKVKSPSEGFLQKDWPERIPFGYLEFQYVYEFCRRIPSNLFERISVKLQRILPQGHYREDWTDIVYVQIGNIKLIIQKQPDKRTNPKLFVRIRAPFGDLILLWRWCLNTYENVLHDLVEQSAVSVLKVFLCPHCILMGYPWESTYKLPLDGVMHSKCDEQDVDLCLNPSSDGPRKTIIPSAFLRPIPQGTTLHLCFACNFCLVCNTV